MANYKSPQELRERATRLAVEARRDPDTRTGAMMSLGVILPGYLAHPQ